MLLYKIFDTQIHKIIEKYIRVDITPFLGHRGRILLDLIRVRYSFVFTTYVSIPYVSFYILFNGYLSTKSYLLCRCDQKSETKFLFIRYHLDLCKNVFGEGIYPEVDATNIYYGGTRIAGPKTNSLLALKII